jgi:signal transduction histidine kinase
MSRLVSRCRTRVEMSKRFVDPALSGSLYLVFLVSLIWRLGTPAFAQSQPQAVLAEKNVLILHTLESSTPLSLETNRGLLDTLRIGGTPVANLFFESMDLRRNPGSELRKLLAEQMHLKWSHRKADMIITVYPEALEFVLNDCRDVFPHVPIIALHLPQNYMIAETGRKIIGHFPTYDITGTIDYALKLVPGTKRVYVVSGAHKVDKWLEDQARLASKKWERVEFLYLSHMTIEDILATVSKAPPGSVILYLALTQDVAGKSHTGLGLAHDLSQVSTVPVFGLFESALGYGVTGGALISWSLIGKSAGQLVIDILKRVKTLDDVPSVLDVPSIPMFDWRQLRRWNLSEAALPKGGIVINREVTFWDFKYYIIGGLAFLVVETTLIIFLIVQRRRKKVAEAEVARARAELLRVERLLRLNEMTGSLAHELNQPLAAILSNAQAGLRFLQSGKIDLDEIREILQDIVQDDQRAGNVIRSLRSMVKREEVERNPVILNNVLNDIIQIFHTESIFRNVHVETELDGSLPPIMGDKVQLQQVALNLILNAADAISNVPSDHRKIILRTEVKDGRIRVTVRDFGPGIDKENLERIFEPFFSTKGTGLGMGLNICRTIVEAHGGRIWAENNPDKGATFVFELPTIRNQ